jgi:hypothetical protein
MKMDQDEIIAFAATLKADITALETGLRASGKDVPPRPEVPRFNGHIDIVENAERLEAHRAALKMLCNVAGVKVQLTPAKPHVKTETEAESTAPGSRKLTATQKALAAKGMTFEEWREKQNPKPKITLTGLSAKCAEMLAGEGKATSGKDRPECHKGMPPERELDEKRAELTALNGRYLELLKTQQSQAALEKARADVEVQRKANSELEAETTNWTEKAKAAKLSPVTH